MEVKKGYKQTEVGVIPSDWDVKTVSQFGEVKRGAGSQYTKYVNNNGVRFIRINDFFEDNPVYVLPTDDMMRFAINEYDVLFAGTGASAGASYIPRKDWIGLPHSYNAPRIRVNKNQSKEFLLYSLQSEYVAKQQKAWFVGAAQPFLDTTAISNFKVATPPTRAEQTAIAAVLSDADALISSLEKLIDKKRNIKQGAMQELLTGKKRLPGFSGKWETNAFGSMTEINKGQQLNKSELTASGEYPDWNGGIEPSGYTSKWNMAKNTITISEGGNSCGFVNYCKTKFWLGGHCYSLKITNTDLEKDFLYQFLKFKEKLIMSLRIGSGLPNIQKKSLNELELFIPKDKTEQTAIASVLSDMDAAIEALEQKLAKYRMIKQGMMQELLTGKTRLI